MLPGMTSAGTSPSGTSPSGTSSGTSEVDLLLRLARRWRSLGLQEAAEHGLSPHQERALLALARVQRRSAEEAGAPAQPWPGVRVSRLAEHLGIAPRSATEVADALEAAGLLTRSPDPTDRRAVLLALTDEGLHTVSRVRERRRAAGDDALATLSAEDRAELRRMLEALLDT